MDDLIKLVVQRTGIQEDQAKTAIETVLNFLKQKLPAPISSQLDGLLAGGGLQQATQALPNLFNKK